MCTQLHIPHKEPSLCIAHVRISNRCLIPSIFDNVLFFVPHKFKNWTHQHSSVVTLVIVGQVSLLQNVHVCFHICFSHGFILHTLLHKSASSWKHGLDAFLFGADSRVFLLPIQIYNIIWCDLCCVDVSDQCNIEPDVYLAVIGCLNAFMNDIIMYSCSSLCQFEWLSAITMDHAPWLLHMFV